MCTDVEHAVVESHPRVSVVVAACNAEATLVETLSSVAAQTYHDFELIVVDDGSSDATPRLLEICAQRWTWLRWERQENRGVAAARSRGIELARGEWIAFLDADDLWLPRKLDAQMAVVDRDPEVSLVYCDVRYLSRDREARHSLFEERAHATGWVLRELFMNNFVYTSTALVKKSAVLEVGGFDRAHLVNEDVDLWLRIAERHKFGCVEEVLVKYRRAPGTLTRVHPYACLQRDLEIIDYWVRRRPDLFSADSAQVRRGRALTFARMGAQYLFDRDFAQARNFLRRAMALGQRDIATLLRTAAAYFPPLAYLFWWAKESCAFATRARGSQE
ncbi:MAG TPA: glycosyltransferase [Rhodanobacteraceae bacterium]|nr:glycosyltransferase [Rhodanobacteraceae bacterium]